MGVHGREVETVADVVGDLGSRSEAFEVDGEQAVYTDAHLNLTGWAAAIGRLAAAIVAILASLQNTVTTRS